MFSERTTLQRLLLLKALSGGGQSLVERTALGNPLTFGTDVSKPLKSLLIPFTPQQSGTGDPSPENVRPILPWNGLKVFGGGKNLLDITKTDKVNPGVSGSTITIANGVISIDEVASSARTYVKFSQEFEPGTYTIQAKNTGAVSIPRLLCNIEFPGSSYSSFYEAYALSLVAGSKSLTFTLPEKAKIGIVLNNVTGESGNPGSLYDIQLEAGSTATAYEPYKPITETDITFASPVYGGTLDVVSGVLTVEWELFNLGGFSWNKGTSSGYTFFWCIIDDMKQNDTELLCSQYLVSANNNSDLSIYKYTYNNRPRLRIRDDSKEELTTQEFASAMDGVYVASTLATPQTVQLTPAQITALVGNNTIWSDADGSMTCVYLVSSKYAEEHPVGGLGSGLGSGMLGAGSEDNPEDPADDPIEDPEEEIPDNTEEGSESDD